MNDTSFWLGSEFSPQLVQIDSAEELHGIIKQPLGCSPIIINCHGIWVSELAGNLDFVLETRGGLFISEIGAEQFDRHRSSQQCGPSALDHHVCAAADCCTSTNW